MCQNKNDGCRCAADTRPAFTARLVAIDGGQITMSDLAELLTAATAHAATPSGQDDVRAAAAARTGTIAMLLTDAADKGRAVAASQQAKKLAAAAATPASGRKPRRASGQPRAMTTPGGWRLSAHLLAQAARKGITQDALIAAVDTPATAYASGRYPGQLKHIRDGICVAVDPDRKEAITCFLDRVETDLRADQRDADAVAWDRQRRQPRTDDHD